MNPNPAPPSELTTRDYWDGNWGSTTIPTPVDPDGETPESHYFAVMHGLFERARREGRTDGHRLLEVGCGGSRWLPYFRRAFGFDVHGIDFSLPGIDLANAILAKAGERAEIVHGDLFDPPAAWVEHFDMVVSFGLVEHFDDTSRAVSACSRYLRPGGAMVTLVPTMRGLYGAAYRVLNPAVYHKHVPQSAESLARAHATAGLTVRHACYVLGLPGLLTPPTTAGLARRIAFGISRAYWRLERSGLGIPPNRFTSPYAVIIATKPPSPAPDSAIT